MTLERTGTGGPPMVRIDGGRVRRLRESRGLTQLYVASSVGVTTDTISRWENRRYPAVKKENALKLAEALEVSLEDILERERVESSEGEQEQPQEIPGPLHGGIKRPLFLNRAFLAVVSSAVLIVGLAAVWWFSLQSYGLVVSASRLLPSHAAPGQPFPVVISVSASENGSLSFILKESLPRGCTLLKADPPATAVNRNGKDIKWIGTMRDGRKVFSFLVRIDPESSAGGGLHFDGSVTVRKGRSVTVKTDGPDVVEVGTFHWADDNRDGRIDDQEILTVYDEFGALTELDFGKEEIEEIWSGGGYRWNGESRSFVILP